MKVRSPVHSVKLLAYLVGGVWKFLRLRPKLHQSLDYMIGILVFRIVSHSNMNVQSFIFWKQAWREVFEFGSRVFFYSINLSIRLKAFR